MTFRVSQSSDPDKHDPGVLATEQSTSSAMAQPKVAVLLCTFQGQNYLVEQLDSIAAQTYTHFKIWASDDGSQDGTCAILEAYKTRLGEQRLSIHAGPRMGFAANFLSLLLNESIQADAYAYSDQDDIWEADKLKRAMDWLRTIPPEIPALYCSRTRLVDAKLNPMGFSPLFKKPPSFANALVQNIAGGNTMVFNQAARKILQRAGQSLTSIQDVVSHDWWAYLVITGCEGRVFYDAHPSLRYRQHSKNLIGMNSSWAACLTRIRLLGQGRFRRWNDQNIQALQPLQSTLTPKSRAILRRFSAARERSLIPRLWGLKRSGIYRQTFLDNLGLIVAAIFKKI